MRKLLSTISLSAAVMVTFAQQDPQVTHNMFNRLTVNPAVAGLSGSICGNMIARQQWTGWNGKPVTYILNVDAPVNILKGGAGLTVYSDQLGFEKTFSATLNYSYHLNLGSGKLGIGAAVGVLNKSINGTWIAPDGTQGQSDPSIPNGVSDITLDANFGVFYENQKLFAGISTTHLNAGTLSKNAGTGSLSVSGVTTSIPKELNYQMARHYYVIAGYRIEASPDIDVIPSVFVKTDASSTQLDVNARGVYKKMFWLGASYRITDAIAVLAGFQKDLNGGKSSVRVGYAYDLTMSDLKVASKGSHELILGYCFKIIEKPDVQKQRNVRFL